jgi:hypothetical protein
MGWAGNGLVWKKRSFVGGLTHIFVDCCNFVTDAACLRAVADAYATTPARIDFAPSLPRKEMR